MDVETSPKLIISPLSPAQRQAALLLAKGCTQADTARTIGRTKWTVGQWLRCNPHFQAEVDRLLEESKRQILKRLPVLTELALDALEQALRAPFLSGARLGSARYVIDRLLALSEHLAAHDGAEVITAGWNSAPIDEDVEVPQEKIGQVEALEGPSAEQIQAVLQRAKAAVARYLEDGRGQGRNKILE